MRGRMNDAESYAPPVNVGGVMEGEVVAEVVRSRHPSFSRGELIQGRIGWRTHAAVAVRDLQRVDTGLNIRLRQSADGLATWRRIFGLALVSCAIPMRSSSFAK